jgi:L-asparaginase
MKKILLIHTGGTFGMIPREPSHTLAPGDIRDLILKYLPEINSISDIDFEVIFNIDSANIQIHHWQRLGQLIKKNYRKYNGFVIIHGTDSMVYTAAALSFMLQGLDKPVILTGAQRPLALIRSDARGNLINSIELATTHIPEVGIFFSTRLYRGNRTIKISSISYEAFDSPNTEPLAKVGLDITLSDEHLPPGKKLSYTDDFSDQVFNFRYHPGLTPEHLEFLIESPFKAIIIESLGVGNLSTHEKSFIPFIEALKKAGKLVVLTSQSPFGRIRLDLYECGRQIEKAGGISAGDMTTECAVVKLMYLLGHYPDDIQKIAHLLQKSLAGEITETN